MSATVDVHIWSAGGWRACDTAADWSGSDVTGVTCRECLEAAGVYSMPPEVVKGDPATCRHIVMDEFVGARWGFEDCIECGKRFPARDEINDDLEMTEPNV